MRAPIKHPSTPYRRLLTPGSGVLEDAEPTIQQILVLLESRLIVSFELQKILVFIRPGLERIFI